VQSLLEHSTLKSLLSTHPPFQIDGNFGFQIDGNFGGSAGIAEMLLQSQNNELHILPALPDNWSSGSIKGIRARGGYTVDISWKEGKLISLVINADHADNCRIRYKDAAHDVRLVKGKNNVKL